LPCSTTTIALELIALHDGDAARDVPDNEIVRNLAAVLATDVTIEVDRVPPRFAATMAAR